MVSIRLRRQGRKNAPFYRIVAADERSPRDGRFIEVLGTYFPTYEPVKLELKADRLKHYLEKGAKISETVASLCKKNGIAVGNAASRE